VVLSIFVYDQQETKLSGAQPRHLEFLNIYDCAAVAFVLQNNIRTAEHDLDYTQNDSLGESSENWT